MRLTDIRRLFCCLMYTSVLLWWVGCQTVIEQRLAEEYYNLGNTFFDIEDYDRAVAQYTRALTIDPNFSRAEYNLVFSYLELNRYDDARELLEQLLERDPENLLLRESDAYVDHLSGETEQALEKYEQVLEIDPQRASTLYNMALIHYTNEEYEKGENLLETAYRIDQDDRLVTYYYILTKNALERPPEEIRQLTRDILTQSWDDYAKLLQLGILLEELRYFSDAQTAYQSIEESATQYSEALFRIGRILLIAIGEPQDGFESIEQALEAGFRDDDLFVEFYNDERLLQQRQLAELFSKYDITVERESQ